MSFGHSANVEMHTKSRAQSIVNRDSTSAFQCVYAGMLVLIVCREDQYYSGSASMGLG